MPNFVPAANWQLIHDNLVQAVYISRNPDSYLPIPPIALSYSLPYRYLRIAANNQNAKSSWKYAGQLEIMVDDIGQCRASRESLVCNRAVIIAIPDFLDRYRLTVTPPYWFDELALVIEGYIGS